MESKSCLVRGARITEPDKRATHHVELTLATDHAAESEPVVTMTAGRARNQLDDLLQPPAHVAVVLKYRRTAASGKLSWRGSRSTQHAGAARRAAANPAKWVSVRAQWDASRFDDRRMRAHITLRFERCARRGRALPMHSGPAALTPKPFGTNVLERGRVQY
jgi:hypothetical protein